LARFLTFLHSCPRFSVEVPIRDRGGAGVEAEERAEVEVTRVFIPEAILPAQVLHPPAESWLQRLCLAILEDALKCLEARVVRKRRVVARARHEAWAWVLSDADYCFSFPTVCAVLQLDGEAVRKQLRARFAGGVLQAGVSRQLQQPLSRSRSTMAYRREA
jgi:hypothetical protein